MNYNSYLFEGYFGLRKPLVYNVIGTILAGLIIVFFLDVHISYSLLTLLLLHMILIIHSIYKVKKSKVLISEIECLIIEYKLFGLLKVSKQFSIIEEERETLLDYFYQLENSNEIHTFSIKSINDLLDNKITFLNKNIISE